MSKCVIYILCIFYILHVFLCLKVERHKINKQKSRVAQFESKVKNGDIFENY